MILQNNIFNCLAYDMIKISILLIMNSLSDF